MIWRKNRREGGGAEQACGHPTDFERVAAFSPYTGSVAPLMSMERWCDGRFGGKDGGKLWLLRVLK